MKADDLEFTYYWIKDKNLIGKAKRLTGYIYDDKLNEWVLDDKSILSDRIIGYDGDGIGSSDMMDRLEEITEEQAMEIINNLKGLR